MSQIKIYNQDALVIPYELYEMIDNLFKYGYLEEDNPKDVDAANRLTDAMTKMMKERHVV